MIVGLPTETSTTTTVVLAPYINSTECLDLLGVSRTTLRRWRIEGFGPRAYSVGRRYRYKTAEVIAFIEGDNPSEA